MKFSAYSSTSYLRLPPSYSQQLTFSIVFSFAAGSVSANAN
jgi:hypothetical protein